MNELKFKHADVSYTVNADRTFTGDRGGNAIKGTWTAESAESQNSLTLKEDGAAAVNVPVVYDFLFDEERDLYNILQVTVGDVAAIFTGTIKIDDGTDIVYALDGRDDGFILYGKLSFEREYKLLVITSGEKRCSIEGKAVLTDNPGPWKKEADLLQFEASTFCKADGKPARLADIKFTGSLDVEGKSIVFIGSFEGKKTFNLVLAGRYEMGTFGLRIFSDGGSTSIALETGGAFRTDRTAGTWKVSIGYSNNELELGANLNFKTEKDAAKGESTLNGELKFKGTGSDFKVDLTLDGTFSIGQDKTVTFNITGGYVSGVTTLTLAGTLSYNGKTLTLETVLGKNLTSVRIGYQGEKLSGALSILSENGKITGSFMILYKFKIGGGVDAGPTEKINKAKAETNLKNLKAQGTADQENFAPAAVTVVAIPAVKVPPEADDRSRFEGFLKKFTFKWECVYDSQGKVIADEDPSDPNGLTKYGIDLDNPKKLTPAQLRKLTEKEAVEIYYQREWASSHAKELPVPLGELCFDMTVADSPVRALEDLQTACGITGKDIDGEWGPQTKGAVRKASQDPQALLRAADRMLDLRTARYRDMLKSNPKMKKHLTIYLNRTVALRKHLEVPDVL